MVIRAVVSDIHKGFCRVSSLTIREPETSTESDGYTVSAAISGRFRPEAHELVLRLRRNIPYVRWNILPGMNRAEMMRPVVCGLYWISRYTKGQNQFLLPPLSHHSSVTFSMNALRRLCSSVRGVRLLSKMDRPS